MAIFETVCPFLAIIPASHSTSTQVCFVAAHFLFFTNLYLYLSFPWISYHLVGLFKPLLRITWGFPCFHGSTFRTGPWRAHAWVKATRTSLSQNLLLRSFVEWGIAKRGRRRLRCLKLLRLTFLNLFHLLLGNHYTFSAKEAQLKQYSMV